ncbi:hypothetical protein THII_3460 [Thioploca ingrica]|uniref:Secreted protein n=1 Tax=Thioploca ingrica TaxID=40754 RepID=A0A090ANP4_9GAMM|nr:hypothetical protein THII_3460 [Thioploca ingrica]
MKKTSMLVTAAILFGASSTYVLAEEFNIYPGMSDEEINAILAQVDPVLETEPIIAEDAVDNSTSEPMGSNKPAPLPSYITVDDSKPVNKHSLCPNHPPFFMTGAEMAQFPVTVTFAGGGTEKIMFKSPGTAAGTNWMLVEVGDTWTNQWRLYTTVPITQIKLELLRKVGSPKGVFDIRGPRPFPPEHTPGSAKGQPITQKLPVPPPVIFTAVYSEPVLIPGHGTGTSVGGTWPETQHDLYGTLTINFTAPALGLRKLPALFNFLADTDCLPVQEVMLNSYNGTTLNFTVVGEGAVSIMERAKDGVSLTAVQGPFTVDRGDGQKTFTTQFTPQSSFCYSMMDVDNLNVMTPEHCF